MDGGLRKRPTAVAATMTPKPTISASTAAVETGTSIATKHDPSLLPYRSGWRRRFIIFVVLAFRMLGCGLYIAGFVWRVSLLHTGSECEMTYSYRNFLEIQTTSSAANVSSSNKNKKKAADDSYKLYKFVDGRDPRYQRLLRDPQPLVGNYHCRGDGGGGGGNNNNASTVVLYVPGHWGSYDQARSIGAHGTQWTRARQDSQKGQRAMMDGTWSGKAGRLEDFIYEVYAVDFSEQGGALHGRFLELQSDFVAQVVQSLAENCSVDRIIIVAHSMGGYVARLAPIRHPHIQRYLHNIVTLATPHGNPLYAFDESIHRVHQSLVVASEDKDDDVDMLVVSISGGLRDEMIDPQACAIQRGASPSYLATSLVPNGVLGMDHRAIVWCHGVLEQVRKVIWVLSKGEADDVITSTNSDRDKRSEKVAQVLGMSSPYEMDLSKLSSTLTVQYGKWKALAMKSAMLYNLPMLYCVYAIGAGLYWAMDLSWILYDGYASVVPFDALGTLLLYYTGGWYTTGSFILDHDLLSLLIWVAVANTLHRGILALLLWWVSSSAGILSHRQQGEKQEEQPPPKQQSVHLVWWILNGFIFVLVGLLAVFLVAWRHWTIRGVTGCFLYVAGVLAVYFGSLWLVRQDGRDEAVLQISSSKDGRRVDNRHSRRIAWVALILLTTPGIVAGKVALLVWEQDVDDPRSWKLWVMLVLPVMILCGFLTTGRRTSMATQSPQQDLQQGHQQQPQEQAKMHFTIHKGTTSTSRSSSSRSWSFTLVSLLVVVAMSRWILVRGNAFRVGHLVFAVSLTEVLREVCGRLLVK